MIRKGTYVLFLHFDDDLETEVGSLGTVRLKAGDYCYVGSAMAGLDQRLHRHLSKEKKIRWHIDYLTTRCDHMRAMESYPDFIPECDLASMMVDAGGISAVRGFGCSDCHCETHLFRIDVSATEKMLESAEMRFFIDN